MSQLAIAAIIMAATFIAFFHPKVPNVVVALGSALVFTLAGIVDVNTLFNNFTSATCILMISMMTVGGAMFQTGLGGWVGNKLIKLTGTKTGRVQFAVFLVTLVLSSVFTGTATLMVMYPLMCSLSISTKKSMSDLVLYQMTGSSAGSWLTFAGAGMIGASAGVLEANGFRIWNFFEIAWFGVPRLIVIIPLTVFFMNRFVIPKDVFLLPDETAAKDADKLAEKLTPKMIIVLVILVLTLVGFIVNSPKLPIQMCAALGAFACLATGCLSPKQMYASVSWDTIILIGGMSAFARGMQNSGFGKLIAEQILHVTGAGVAPFFIILTLMLVTGIITQFMSDNATVALMAPIAITLAASQGLQPYAYVMACLVGCSICHISIMASPSMAFSMGIGGYRPKDFAKWALMIELPSALIAGLIMIPIVWL